MLSDNTAPNSNTTRTVDRKSDAGPYEAVTRLVVHTAVATHAHTDTHTHANPIANGLFPG